MLGVTGRCLSVKEKQHALLAYQYKTTVGKYSYGKSMLIWKAWNWKIRLSLKWPYLTEWLEGSHLTEMFVNACYTIQYNLYQNTSLQTIIHVSETSILVDFLKIWLHWPMFLFSNAFDTKFLSSSLVLMTVIGFA